MDNAHKVDRTLGRCLRDAKPPSIAVSGKIQVGSGGAPLRAKRTVSRSNAPIYRAGSENPVLAFGGAMHPMKVTLMDTQNFGLPRSASVPARDGPSQGSVTGG